MLKLHISLHDVAPIHLKRVMRAEKLLRELGVSAVTYLMVPDFHKSGASEQSNEFLQFCREERPFELEWALHGLHHIELPHAGGGSAKERFARRWMTGGEGEFLALRQKEAVEQLRIGIQSYREIFEESPNHFVPPAWLWHPELPLALTETGLRSFEAHRGVAKIKPDGNCDWIDAPVISWATRTWLRRNGAKIVCPVQNWLWRNRSPLRIALHPHDFDWPNTVESIRHILTKELARRQAVTISQLLF